MGGGRKERGGTHRRGGARRRLAGGRVTRKRRHACGTLPGGASRKEEVHRRRRCYGEMGFRCAAGPSAATSASEKVEDNLFNLFKGTLVKCSNQIKEMHYSITTLMLHLPLMASATLMKLLPYIKDYPNCAALMAQLPYTKD
uniref:Uncharacterized protein n=1 Tax=Triticum urartu TaxID=4572 RepID=A0A8R7U3G0_TRIUA